MISVVAAIISTITIASMAYISYKYPFNNEKGEITKYARWFRILVVISIISGIVIIYDSYNTKTNNDKAQQSLNDTIGVVNANINKLTRSIDSLGYKKSKDGEWILKNPKTVENSATVKSGNSTVQQNSVKDGKPLIQQNKTGDNQANQNNATNKGVVGNGNDNHVISGNGNNVGVNGDVVNGLKQRHLTENEYDMISLQIPFDSKIMILVSGGKEAWNYTNELYRALLNSGYKDIKASNWMDPDGYDSIGVQRNGNSVTIKIYPESNVQ